MKSHKNQIIGAILFLTSFALNIIQYLLSNKFGMLPNFTIVSLYIIESVAFFAGLLFLLKK
ncbi:MAG: hypothetical protein A2Y62_02000 [Candidatus Fischerbacteria bacterium RBG_13_37_8]|uniref:Uncharacterized protein n=1 Tax=Candidatus Fischerbacteria bacterium RBG_13_37_8 TaxID=1817863 RepID=A0A1F5VL02_9BACT|nr:MAG: hypothetical protein A2Y62_02000 [Candidatus Fischerbacteria bacterium RBG_13_37_8]